MMSIGSKTSSLSLSLSLLSLRLQKLVELSLELMDNINYFNGIFLMLSIN
jgi:hypothetical protein